MSIAQPVGNLVLQPDYCSKWASNWKNACQKAKLSILCICPANYAVYRTSYQVCAPYVWTNF